MMIVGEQPGDREDREGAPFVGPAGRLLDKLLADAEIDRREVYVTNAVKHFKWKRKGRGKRRIHDKPSAGQITACRPWLEAELEVVGPEVVVGLGATAGRALLGPKFRVTRDRGSLFEPDESGLGLEGDRPLLTATLHPSALLRIDEEEERRRARAEVVADLRVAASALA
jgi:uracil-DNA glycosylase